jgi:predicted nucleic acid-binding protein
MRVVLDTNVLARSVRGGSGPAAELLGMVMVPPHTFLLSPFILSELSRVLRYERMRKLHMPEPQSAWLACLCCLGV